jgi:osmotically-inducible protein OsmY
MQSMQSSANEFTEVFKFRFDAATQASDGPAGKVSAVVADAEQRAITHAAVKLGVFFGASHYVPLDLVADANADQLSLSIPLAEVKKLPTSAAAGAVLSASTLLVAAGKRLGHLTQLTINRETRILRHLVVDRGVRGEALVPASMIVTMTSKQIGVNLGAATAQSLVPFRRDADLHAEAYAAIYDYEPLRIDLPGIEIHAIDGVIWLKGHVSSDLNKRLVSDQLQGITGLDELHNELLADTDLAGRISMALGRDPCTAGQMIGVYPQLGVVRLRGNVRTPEARAAAGEIASVVPGVKRLENELHVDPHADVVPVMAGVTNSEDVVPGGG